MIIRRFVGQAGKGKTDQNGEAENTSDIASIFSGILRKDETGISLMQSSS